MRKVSDAMVLCAVICFFFPLVVLGEQTTPAQDGVSLTYQAALFSKLEIVEVRKEPLRDSLDRLNVHPANLLFLFYKNSQHIGSIKLYPLQDLSVKNLRAAYPELPERLVALARILHDRPMLPQRFPDGTPRELPTIQNQMARQYFLSHVRYLDFSWGSAIGFLVQYAQDASEYVVGSRLDYQIEGLTADGRIAISAYFHVSHPDLPPAEKDGIVTDKNGEPIGEEAYLKYLGHMEALLEGKREASFRPPLDSIQKLVESLRFKNVDPADWGSKFSGKTTVIE
jgi:hypothetical protein